MSDQPDQSSDEDFSLTTPGVAGEKHRAEFMISPKHLFSVNDLSKLLDEKLKPVKKEIAKFDKSLSAINFNKLENENRKLLQEVYQLRNQVSSLESHTRRNNIRFYGISEVQDGKENCESKLLQILGHLLDINDRTFERVHRLGYYKPNSTRPIIARVGHFKDKMMIFRKKSELKEKYSISISDDYAKDVQKNRKKLYPVFKEALKLNKQAKLQGDCLIIDSVSYQMDNLDSLPAELKPENVFTPSNKGITAFFTESSLLSNFYKCEIKVNDVLFNCMEQYKIKFMDKKLQHFLLATNNTLIVEGSSDKTWGIGLSLWDPRIWNREEHCGRNLLGKLLENVRDSIRKT